MGWLNKLIALLKSTSQLKLTLIYFDQLNSWLEEQKQELYNKSNLKQECSVYLKLLHEKRWWLECKLDEWGKKVTDDHKNINQKDKESITSLFQEVRKFLELITLSETSSFTKIDKTKSEAEDKLDKLIKNFENSPFSHNFSFLLDENEKKETIVNPLLQELLFLNTLMENFEQKLSKNKVRKVKQLFYLKDKLEEYQQEMKKLTEILEEKQNRLKAVKEKKLDKEKILEKVKTDPLYEELLFLQENQNNLLNNLQPKHKDFQLKLADVEYRVNHFSQQFKNSQDEIEDIEQELAKLKEFKARDKRLLESSSEQILNKRIIIKFFP